MKKWEKSVQKMKKTYSKKSVDWSNIDINDSKIELEPIVE